MPNDGFYDEIDRRFSILRISGGRESTEPLDRFCELCLGFSECYFLPDITFVLKNIFWFLRILILGDFWFREGS